jgi:hypothetical protein
MLRFKQPVVTGRASGGHQPVSRTPSSRRLRREASISSRAMTNRFGLVLYPKELRWAAAEAVSQDVIAAVLLLHDRSVDEIVPKLGCRKSVTD